MKSFRENLYTLPDIIPVRGIGTSVFTTSKRYSSETPCSRRDKMTAMPSTERLELVQGDITKQPVDAIVNAANSSLLGGGGVDGAIHRAAGPKLLEETRTLGGCPTGEARITKGYRLPAEYVIHTVGPVWRGGHQGEPQLLASCYQSCFRLAVENGVKTIAFPSISTGVYGYPIERASIIALTETKHFFGRDEGLERVVMVLFSEADLRVYERAYREVF